MDVIAMGTFLECLEPYIINDKLQVMPPAVMKDFVTHYETKGLLENVEACIVHMNVASLDIHNVSISVRILNKLYFTAGRLSYGSAVAVTLILEFMLEKITIRSVSFSQ